MLKKFFEFTSNLNTNFWKWFGDSKIVDTKGKPLVLYHGTNNKFNTFDINQIGKGSGNYGHYGYGFYFSYDIREANNYGDLIYKCYVKILNPFIGTNDEIIKLKNLNVGKIDDLTNISIDIDSLESQIKKIDNITYEFIKLIRKYGYEKGWETFLDKYDTSEAKLDLNDISDILNYTTINKNSDGIPEYIFTILNDIGIDIDLLQINKGFSYKQSLHWITDLGNLSKEVSEAIIELGYDGVIYGSEVVAFNANQIKSVDNDGTWNDDDLNIYS